MIGRGQAAKTNTGGTGGWSVRYVGDVVLSYQSVKGIVSDKVEVHSRVDAVCCQLLPTLG